ncbi:MAG: hypothetical protein COV91_03680 [Candidatus Taylorbacteria bacterium CG11_big_fil_rev_8_21_14_0_20_46_11]|uniref:Cardiolipin synthase N-terminal domain-containing protein n=1 Tax=Candidatus Taylorbacteria bacterium CG11_big_fil_rev_8_21_14_0_20_46_11 TaxID=1975025 RepID=A0A2H0KB86_9BACT|nr:MAG: hypothetical protein COV91_03680 [Candidatus Taylorbacteria bacterium CG11_big_fil_rev_8_21_14_0_20_46_11]
MKTKQTRSVLLSVLLLFVFSVAFAPGTTYAGDCADTDYRASHITECASWTPPSGQTTMGSLYDVIAAVQDLIYFIMPIVVTLAVLVILWGIFGYVMHGDEEEKRTQGKQFIIWGIIGLFVMLSIWGLVNVLKSTFSLKNDPPSAMPMLPAIPAE